MMDAFKDMYDVVVDPQGKPAGGSLYLLSVR